MARKFKKNHKLLESYRIQKNEKRKKHRANRNSRTHHKILSKAKRFVTNLSPCPLSANQICLIAKGQKFVPLTKLDKVKLMQDIHELGRKMRIKCLFQDEESKSLHPFWERAVNYTPPSANNSVEDFIHALLMECSELNPDFSSSNLNSGEKKAISELTTNRDIVLRPADKGSNTVVMSKKQYDDECCRQLTGSVHYEEIETPHTSDTYESGLKIVHKLHRDGYMDKQTYAYLYHPRFKPRVPKFYLLPKLHKLNVLVSDLDPMTPSMHQSLRIPGRPIIAQCDGPTERISRYLDYFLVPIVKKDPIYLLDSKELLHILDSTTFPPDVLIISFDITSMYSNMDHDELLASTRKALVANFAMDFGLQLPPISEFMNLLEIVLTKSEFTYNERHFKQIVGAAMGSVCSPEVCDIRMLELLREILPKFRHRNKILLNKKYRDDGFIIFNGTLDEAQELCTIANSAHPLLKFEFNISASQCIFLDLNIYKGTKFAESGKFDSKTHTKVTECYAYLSRTSAHPPACFRGFIKGELGRYRRNASNETCFLKKAQSFREKLLNRGYQATEFDNCLYDMKYKDRKIVPRKANTHKERVAPPLVISTLFHPKLWALNRIIRKYWPVVLRNPKNMRIFPRPPMIAYRRGKNLSELLKLRR
jgi:hypothetical protein